jgi:hypothetical protein
MSVSLEALVISSLNLVGITPTTDDSAYGLDTLKAMLYNWSSQDMFSYYTAQDTFPLDGSLYYTIGYGGTFGADRPISITGAYIDAPDNKLELLTEAEYRDNKPGLWYNPEYPLGKIYINPLYTGTLYLFYLVPLIARTKVVAGTSLVKDSSGNQVIISLFSVPSEYERAIEQNLVVRFCLEYGRPIPDGLFDISRKSVSDIISRNMSNKLSIAEIPWATSSTVP